MVDSQQEQVDQVEDNMADGRAYTESGAKQIHMARIGFCGVLQESQTFPSREFLPDPVPSSTRSSKQTHQEPFRWTMPLETLREDFAEVRKDLVGLGADIMSCTPRVASKVGWCSSRRAAASKVSDKELVFSVPSPSKMQDA